MQVKINSVIKEQGQYQLVSLFGHSSRGLPGLEIVGLGLSGRALKEKIIYFTKSMNLKIPARRYVLCLDSTVKMGAKEEGLFLEFPFFILFLALAEQVPIAHLDDCIALGRMDLGYNVLIPFFSSEECFRLTKMVKHFIGPGPKWILPKNSIDRFLTEAPLMIGAEDLFINWPMWSFKIECENANTQNILRYKRSEQDEFKNKNII